MNWTLSEIFAGLALVAVNAVIAAALLLALASSFNVVTWN
jgi:hypothetical protein